MRRTALVIGSQTGKLSGVHNDVATMTTLLTERGFDVDCRTEKDATQEGIREGCERLITDARDGDATVIYYSGHGAKAQVNTRAGNPLPDLDFIVPTDYDASGPGDFRGITALELSVMLARLTERTHNATVILDCCHSGHMVRDNDLRVKAYPHPTYLDVGEHVGMMRALGLQIELPHVVANPWAVRLLACAPWESAFEYTSKGQSTGILTDSLRHCLALAGPARVPWRMLIQGVRNRVSTLAFGQRPEVAGPARRYLFDLEETRGGIALTAVQSAPDRLTLPGAALLGVAPGDQFGITPSGEIAATDATMVARATVTRTDGITVQAAFDLCDGHDTLPPMVEAHPLVTAATSRPVLVRGSGALADHVHGAVDAAPGLRAVLNAEQVGTDAVLAEVEVGASISLWDGKSEPLVRVPANQAGADRIVDELRRLARTEGLLRLAPGAGEELTDPFTVEWGRVVDTVPEPLPPSGTMLHVGEPIYVRLRNDSERTLYFFVFDLGVAGAVTLITARDPGGLRLGPEQEYILGERDRGTLEGSPLLWPDAVPTSDPRTESMLVIVTTAPQDLSVLTHEGAGTVVARGQTPLSRALADAMGAAATRDWRAVDEPSAKYAVKRLDWALSPEAAPPRTTRRFLVDDRANGTLRPRTLAPAGPPPRAVAVRLTDLVVHRNRALRGADVRVDTLVLTGGDGTLPAYRAQTARFSNVRDGDRLPLDSLLVYHGPADGYLDLAWWVSRDRRESLALNDLLVDRLTDESVRQAIGSVSALAVGAQDAALAVTAVSACAIIVATAYDLLSTMVGDSIGLYRASWLANEGFGVGRHPAVGTRSAQDFSFAYEVVAVG